MLLPVFTMGSLMCNYFTNEFATYNNYQNSIGYEVYDPIEYGEGCVYSNSSADISRLY